MGDVEEEIHAIKKGASIHELGQLCRAHFTRTQTACSGVTLSLPFFSLTLTECASFIKQSG